MGRTLPSANWPASKSDGMEGNVSPLVRRLTVPTVEGILADKLTAFAPTTIGVP
jgi:hypothetical protein